MIRIIAQTEPLFTPEEQKRLKVKQLPDETIQDTPPIPLADDEDVSGEPDMPVDKQFAPEEYEELQPIAPPPATPGLPPEAPQPEQEIPQPEEPPLPEEEKKEDEPPLPEDEYEEITEELTELDRLNMSLSIPAKVDMSLAEGYPLRVIYTTMKGHTTERTIRPDYYLPARTTGNWVLIAWCELRNDWRGFIVNRIRAAKLESKNE